MSARVGGSGATSGDSRAARAPSFNSQQARELLPPIKLQELLHEVAPGEILDPEVEEFLQEHVDEFVESVTEFGCLMAKHRRSKVLEARDIQFHLESAWNIRVPGYGDDPRPAKRNVTTPIHNARLQAIQKAQQQ